MAKKAKQSAQNSETKAERRARGLANIEPHKFPKGVSGNPGGRPKTKLLSDAYREVLEHVDPRDPEGRTYAQLIALGQAKQAIRGKVGSATELGDRTEGRPVQAIRMSGDIDQETARIIAELGLRLLDPQPKEPKDGS